MEDKYNYLRIVSKSNGVDTRKQYETRRLRHRITLDFEKSFDCEDVTVNDVSAKMLITRDKGDEQIKKIKSLPDGRFDLGDIINWNGVNYIVYKMDADRRLQSKGRMYECNASLRWRNSGGTILERVGKCEDATKYSEGTQGGTVIREGEFQLKIMIRLDEESCLIKRDDRFFMDADDYIDTMLDNDVIPNVFRVTRRNVVTGTFEGTGYIEVTLVEDQYVAGVDDLENMIAVPKREIINRTDDSGSSEGGWL